MFWTREEYRYIWRKELQLNDLRLQRACKTALACVICILIGLWFQLDQYNWMLTTVFVMMMPASVGATLEKAVLRIVGTAVGALFGVWVVGTFVQHHLLFTLTTFVFFSACFYWGTGKYYAYTFMIAGITAVLVGIAGVDDPHGVVALAANRSFEIILGVIVSALVTMYVWPVYAQDNLRSRLQTTSRSYATLVRRIGSDLLASRDIAADIRDNEDELAASFSTDFNLLHQAESEDSAFRQWEQETTGLILQYENVLARIKAARRACQEGMDAGFHLLAREEVAALVEAVATRFDQLADDIRDGLNVSRMAPVREAIQQLQTRVDSFRAEGRAQEFPAASNRHFSSFMLAMLQISECLEQAEAMVIGLRHHRHRSDLPAPKPMKSLASSHLWQQVAIYDPARIRHAIKAGIAFILLFFFTQTDILAYPVPTLVSATVVLVMTNVGATGRKALLRLLGCVIGGGTAVAAVVFFFPQCQGVVPMLIFSFLVYFAFGYVNVGSALYSYAGLQMAIAYQITVFDTFAPPESIIPVLERLIGVIFGTGVSLLVITGIWPVRALLERRKILSSILSRMARQLETCAIGRQQSEAEIKDEQNIHHTVLMQTQKAMELCVDARFEHHDSVERNAAISSLIRAVQGTFFALVSLEDSLNRSMDPKIAATIRPAFEAYRKRLIHGCDALAAALAGQVDRYQELDLTEESQQIEAAMATIRQQRLTQDLSIETVAPVLNVLERAEQFGFVLSRSVAYAYAAFGPKHARESAEQGWKQIPVQPLAAEALH